MQLNILFFVARLLDPRLWRRRLRQLGYVLAAVTAVWVRAVHVADRVSRDRDARNHARSRVIRARNAKLEERRLGDRSYR